MLFGLLGSLLDLSLAVLQDVFNSAAQKLAFGFGGLLINVVYLLLLLRVLYRCA